MLLTITTTHQPATDLGYLLHKNPARVHSFSLAFGEAHVFYPAATPDCCTAALLVEVDPVGLVRSRQGPSGQGGLLDQYVNDRPYAASSFLSVAMARVFGSALSGTCRDRPELADTSIPLEAELPAIPCRGGSDLIKSLFQPLGYQVRVEPIPLNSRFNEWGDSYMHRLSLKAVLPLRQLLSHLYVLAPVMDNNKHYWIGEAEVEKLLRHGKGWLASHPSREWITRRYLKYRRSLADEALERLGGEGIDPVAANEEESMLERNLEGTFETPVALTHPNSAKDISDSKDGSPEAGREKNGPSLNEQRLGTVVSMLKAAGAASVLDLGCGEGKLLRLLLKDKQFTRIAGMDVSHHALEVVSDRMRFDRLPTRQRERINVFQGSLMYRDARLQGFDAAAVVEVIEHLDPPRLAAFERVLFECARPETVVLTTPNQEFNSQWESLPAGRFRHRDHRFEWTRDEFQQWAHSIADRFSYTVRFLPVGPVIQDIGSPTQMAVFELCTRQTE